MNEVWEKLNSIDSKIDELLQWKAVLDERLRIHQKVMNNLKEEVHGNPYGLKHLVSENAKQIDKLINYKTNISRWRDFLIFILRSLLAAGIIGFAIWVLQIFKAV